MKIFNIQNYIQYLELTKIYSNIILRFSANWCNSCIKIKNPINLFVKDLNILNTVFVDVDFESYQEDENFMNAIPITKLPTFYCENKFNYIGSDIDTIQNYIESLNTINDDF